MPLHLTRRRFLKSTAATAGAVAFAGPVYRALAAEEAAAYYPPALIRALNAHAGQLRHALAQKLSIRKMPELHFVYDDSVEYGARMDHLLHDLVKDLPPEEESEEPA